MIDPALAYERTPDADYITCREVLFPHGRCNTINAIDQVTGKLPERCQGCKRRLATPLETE